ncbi:MAG TPA: phosphatase PAP2 family protein [Saprospiraceae bacterium]|jgi:membrane-associated phospholipid phosphatase|nr:phosphatase PAP2 family protein [Saprospiraceae bacterium]HMT69014.1 phosphatase PAP2 family protein [Saprospiraceae bacterium]
MLNLLTKYANNSSVIENLNKVKASLFYIPLFLLTAIFFYLYFADALSVERYVEIQIDIFIDINSTLGQFPSLMLNLTQLGDALIFLSFLTLLIIYAPKFWESLISASIVSAILSKFLKVLFSVPRPAAILDNETFIIIGKKLIGHSSLPSGHSITTFTIITVLMYAFMPKKISSKVAWIILLIGLGFIIISTRVGVGAHFPLDVIIGGIIGYISGLIGIFISKNDKLWAWIGNPKNYPFFIILFMVCCVVLGTKIYKENLLIYYLSMISLIVSLYKIIYVYIKK